MVLSWLLDFVGIRSCLFTTILFLFIYKCSLKTWNYFSEKNIKFVRGLPFLGAQYRAIFGREPWSTSIERLYNAYPNEKISGSLEVLGIPAYTIRDPELVKQMGIKDFEHFMNHQFRIHETSDALMGRALLFMSDQKWKNMRATLSPAFTGSKLRLMFHLIEEVCDRFEKFLKEDIPLNGKIFDIKDFYTKVANDTIASCAFGLSIDSLQDNDNDFYKAGQVITQFEGLKGLRFFGYAVIPKIMNFFKIKIVEEKEINYFRHVLQDNINNREKNNIVRNDMINLLLEARKGTLDNDGGEQESEKEFSAVEDSYLGPNVKKVTKWTTDDILGQCLIFFVAGFSTVSHTLSFATHEITVNPRIQEKLLEEISAVKDNLNGKPLNYDVLQKMKYLDMVMSETLRRWPQVIVSNRIVNKPYNIHCDGQLIKLLPGDLILFPVQGLHMDSKFYPDPEKFDPERFNDDNKNRIVPGAYMPFGIGPRSCIASRFALMECKAILFHLVSAFRLEKCSKTQIPLKLRINTGTVDAENGFWIQLRPRDI